MTPTTPVWHLGPTGSLLLMAVVVAVPPLLWVLWQSRRSGQTSQRGYSQLLGITVFLTFDLIVFGAFTRLSDSGLGCPDWPGCYGHASPIGASTMIAQAQAAMPTGPVTFSKAWIEMIHRYLASGVGFLVVVLTLWAWRLRALRPHAWVLSAATLVWVMVQGAFGAWTVTWRLMPLVVTAHLLGGLLLLAMLRWQQVRWWSLSPAPPLPGRGWLVALVLALALQLALGGWVSTNYAVLACSDFPTCQGSWWPAADWGQGFTLWRELGFNAQGEGLPFAALTAIHLAHRVWALVVVVLAVGLAALWWRRGYAGPAGLLLASLAWQVASGLSNVVLQWPLVAALAHTAGAALWVAFMAGWLARRAT
ncbi:MAG: COX15/CtaA family protein [Burkholderiaceae bacterium]